VIASRARVADHGAVRRFLVVCSIVAAALASCSMPNFGPPKLGELAAPAVAIVASRVTPS